MLSIWLTIGCNTPETVEVPPIAAITEQTPENKNIGDNSNPANNAVGSVDSPKPNPTVRTAPFFSEVMQMPVKVAKFRGEWIELYNPTDTPVDLSTYSVHSNGDQGVSFSKEHLIQPKATFLMAVRKSPSGNGGLPKVDFLYNHDVLKVTATDWLELRKDTEVIDRWEITRTEVKKGYSLQRDDNGLLCHSTQTYGDGDYGSPKVLAACP